MPTLPPLEITDAEMLEFRKDVKLIGDIRSILGDSHVNASDRIATRLLRAYDAERSQFMSIVRHVEGLAGPSVG